MISRQEKIPAKTPFWLSLFLSIFLFWLGRLSSPVNDGLSIVTRNKSYYACLFSTYLPMKLYLKMTYDICTLSCLTLFTWRMRLTNQIFELRLINSVFNTITLTNKSWICIALLLLQLVTSNIFPRHQMSTMSYIYFLSTFWNACLYRFYLRWLLVW